MTDYLTEQEQIQQLKNWLKQYGPTIVAGIVIALVMSWGWHYYQNYRNNILTQASIAYDEVLGLQAQGKSDQSSAKATQLIASYSKTPYAPLAALLLAHNAIQTNNSSEAITRLKWVMDHSKDSSIREIARIRTARILINDNKPKEALSTLQTIDDNHFKGLIEESRGDALLALNDLPSARMAYKEALAELPESDSTRPLLQMKFDNLTANSIVLTAPGE